MAFEKFGLEQGVTKGFLWSGKGCQFSRDWDTE